MTQFSLNLPADIPWKQIAVSPDMMDTQYGNSRFPYDWRSSLAISAFEPDLSNLPDELSDERVTYLKITATITGYQPSKDEIATGTTAFPSVPTEDLERILQQYFACYGALLEVAVFPSPDKVEELQPVVIDFSIQVPGTELPNPYQSDNATFRREGAMVFNQIVNSNNVIVSLLPSQTANNKGELGFTRDPGKMIVTFPSSPHIEAKVAHRGEPVTLSALDSNGQLIGTKTSGTDQTQIHTLSFESPGIASVVLSSPGDATLRSFIYYEENETELPLPRYPHIIDFEPKSRDLYQLASKTGELLTASRSEVNTSKSHTRTEKTDTGINVGSAYDSGPTPDGDFKGDWRIARDWGTGEQDATTVQSDASRERREGYSSTTNITQMYNLLTGYHLGTNRATFLMLPRPHTLQATSYRTFILGLRIIEGVQEFFLVVSRPRDVSGLKVEAYLETGHFPEDVTPVSPPVEFDESYEDFTVNVYAGSGLFSGETKNLEDALDATHLVAAGFVVDKRPTRKTPEPGPDQDHLGIHQGSGDEGTDWSDNIDSLRKYDYQAKDDRTVIVTGTIESGGGEGAGVTFHRAFRVYTRSEQPRQASAEPVVKTTFFKTCRDLCGEFMSCDKPNGGLNVVTRMAPRALLTPGSAGRPAAEISGEGTVVIDPCKLPNNGVSRSGGAAVKEALRQIHSAMVTTAKRSTGMVRFMESDYFRDRVKKHLPSELLRRTLADVSTLPAPVRERLGREMTVDAALNMDLPVLAWRTGLSIEKAAEVRRQLLGIPL